jgi:hypothetical protein
MKMQRAVAAMRFRVEISTHSLHGASSRLKPKTLHEANNTNNNNAPRVRRRREKNLWGSLRK